MQIRTLIVFFAFAANIQASAQDDDWRLYKPNDKKREKPTARTYAASQEEAFGKVVIHTPHRIDEIDSLKKANPTPMEGYRLQIYFGNRAEAQRVRGEFLRKYPDTGAYISYLAPNFRLRVGDFRTKMECEKLKMEFQREFSGSYIVKDEINLPSLRKGEPPRD